MLGPRRCTPRLRRVARVLVIRARSSAGDFPQRNAPSAGRAAGADRLHWILRRADRRHRRHDMSTRSSSPSVNSAEDQREALAESEKQANENQFREENEEKIVEIPPVDKDDRPIRGLDPKQRPA
jgi:hypothetical protein